MKPERWQQAREVLADALELKPEDRSAFLDRACSSDHALREEVERLLSSSDEVRSGFLQTSALRVTLTPGTELGDYEVKGLVGSGGMGEVYRARDTRLGRDVAIKVLPGYLSQNPGRRHELCERKPIEWVRQSAKRRTSPDILLTNEVQNLLSNLRFRERMLVLLAVTTGLRRSEIFALKWKDIDLQAKQIHVTRSIVQNVVGICKTESSQKPFVVGKFVGKNSGY